MKNSANFYFCIYGPTASGKTERAFQLAHELNADIISFDSRQVYKGMDCVTGKDIPQNTKQTTWKHPSLGELPLYVWENIQLFGFDCVEPNQDWSIAHFYEYVEGVLQFTKKPLIFVGGSWQYAEVIWNPPASLFVPPNKEIREWANKATIQELQNRLKSLKNEIWEKLNQSDKNNPRRLVRAIEVALSSDMPQTIALIPDQKIEKILLTPKPEIVAQKIEERVKNRLESCALPETKRLMAAYTDWESPAFSATGYKLLREYLQKDISKDQLVFFWTQLEKQYAKRQFTWIKRIQKEYSFIQ